MLALAICALARASCVSPEDLRREDEATYVGCGFHAGYRRLCYLSPAAEPGA